MKSEERLPNSRNGTIQWADEYSHISHSLLWLNINPLPTLINCDKMKLKFTPTTLHPAAVWLRPCFIQSVVKISPGWGRRQGNSPLCGCPGPPQHSHLAPSLLVKLHRNNHRPNTKQCAAYLKCINTFTSHIPIFFSRHSPHRIKTLHSSFLPPYQQCVNTYLLRAEDGAGQRSLSILPGWS